MCFDLVGCLLIVSVGLMLGGFGGLRCALE